MDAIILDTGALIAYERNERRLLTAVLDVNEDEVEFATSSTCIAETWRDPARQARLVRWLRLVDEYPLDPAASRATGELMRTAGTSQVADAAVALLVKDGDRVLTSDPDDLEHLLRVRGVKAVVTGV